MIIRFKKLNPAAVLPVPASAEAAGGDLRACIEAPIVIRPHEIVKVPTGLAVETPVGYASLLFPRSGLALKHGISLINSIGLVDADYRGEIGIPLVNHSDKEFVIEPNDRIAQLVVVPYVKYEAVEADSLSDTERGEGGFGHSGVK